MDNFWKTLLGRQTIVDSATQAGEQAVKAAVEVETRLSEAEQRLHNLETRVGVIEKGK